MIEKREGRSVAEIFARDGEPHFRACEREAIAAAVAERDVVVATGGGAVVDDANFRALRDASLLVCLTAEPGVILARTRGGSRPLLQSGDREGRIRELLAARAGAYARVPHSIDTSHLSVDQIVDRILALLEAEEDEV